MMSSMLLIEVDVDVEVGVDVKCIVNSVYMTGSREL